MHQHLHVYFLVLGDLVLQLGTTLGESSRTDGLLEVIEVGREGGDHGGPAVASQRVFQNSSQETVPVRNMRPVALCSLLQCQNHLFQVRQGQVDVFGLVEQRAFHVSLPDSLASRQVD